MTPPIPQELVENIARGDAVLFVGAGLSRGAGLPSWSELILPLADRINLPPERRANLLQVAQDYENKSGRQALEQYLSDQTDTTGKAPTDNHRRLLQLGITTWVTTNFDDLLERTLQEAGQPYRKVVRDQDLPYTSAGKVTVLKLHGDREQTGTMVITQRDFNTFFRRFPQIKTKLAGLVLGKTFLFIGYSVSDPDFNQLRDEIAYDLEEHGRRAYAVLFNTDEYTIADLRRRQIGALSIPLAEGQDPSEALGQFLDELTRELKASPEARLVARPAPARRRLQAPPPPNFFAGRADEIERLVARLTAQPTAAVTVAIQGVGGQGKSALAKKLGKRLEPSFPGGILWVDVGQGDEQASQRADIVYRIAQELGLALEDEPRLEARSVIVRSELGREGRLLAILDGQAGLRVLDGRGDLGPVAHDAGVG